LKTESQYKWKYEGNKVHLLLNSELLEELTQSIWAIDNSKVEYARETITEVIEKIKKAINILRLQLTVMFDNTRVIQSDDDTKINKAENRALL
jgi:flagellin-specific chaperone FliS